MSGLSKVRPTKRGEGRKSDEATAR
jgi:hypothetical protein